MCHIAIGHTNKCMQAFYNLEGLRAPTCVNTRTGWDEADSAPLYCFSQIAQKRRRAAVAPPNSEYLNKVNNMHKLTEINKNSCHLHGPITIWPLPSSRTAAHICILLTGPTKLFGYEVCKIDVAGVNFCKPSFQIISYG